MPTAVFDWLIPGQQSVNPSREAISILSGKCKRFMFVHPVGEALFSKECHQDAIKRRMTHNCAGTFWGRCRCVKAIMALSCQDQIFTRGGALPDKPARDVPFSRVSFFSINS